MEFPEDGYHGEDIVETVKNYIETEGDKLLTVQPDLRREILTRFALQKKLDAIRTALLHYGVEYDTWFSASMSWRASTSRTAAR